MSAAMNSANLMTLIILLAFLLSRLVVVLGRSFGRFAPIPFVRLGQMELALCRLFRVASRASELEWRSSALINLDAKVARAKGE